MSFFFRLVLFSALLYLSTSSYPYGIIRNATIEIPFDVNDDHGHKLEGENCNQCLCNAFSNPNVVLLTCTENEPMNVTCQFYYFMPKRDEIKHPINGTNIYLIQTNKKFEDKDDCCDTAKLIQRITEKVGNKQKKAYGHLRTLAEADNHTIITIAHTTDTDERKMLKFHQSTLEVVDVPPILSLKAGGYYQKKYYFGTVEKTVDVYDEYLNTTLHSIPIKNDITTIRFLNSTEEMLVGAANGDVHICTKDANDGILKYCAPIPAMNIAAELHAIGVVNESAFYAGWFAPGWGIRLYTRDQNGTWKRNDDDNINHPDQTSDIVIDNCKRVWAVVPESDKIMIYHQNKAFLGQINVVDVKLFNLMILENYTLIMSHESGASLNRIQPSLNCRPLS